MSSGVLLGDFFLSVHSLLNDFITLMLYSHFECLLFDCGVIVVVEIHIVAVLGFIFFRIGSNICLFGMCQCMCTHIIRAMTEFRTFFAH